MRFMAPLAIVAAGALLSGCASLQAIADSPTVANVQALAVKGCSFVPTANTIVSLVSAAIPGLNTASAVANAICLAVTPAAKAAPGQPVAPAAIQGIKIEGFYST